MTATLTIESQRDFDDLFADMVAQFQEIDWRPVQEAGFGLLQEQHLAMFNGQREANGKPWAPLRPSTIKRKGHATILFETGRLKASLTQRQHGHGVRETWNEWPQQAGFAFGTDVPYSSFHTNGTERMPARPHIGLTEQTTDAITNQAADHALAELAI